MMSREAALAGIKRFVDDATEATRREFSVGRALRGTGLGPGGVLIDRLRRNADALERRVVEPELEIHRRRSIDQLRVVLDAVESDAPFDAFGDEILAHDGYLDSLDPGAPAAVREAVVADVLDRTERLGSALEPIVSRPENDFWDAMRGAYDRETARSVVEETFPFTGPLRRHRNAFVFRVDIDPGDVLGGPLAGGLPSASIDYTDEAIRAMTRAERRVVHETKRELDRRYEAGG